MQRKECVAMLLAGGQGSRLGVLTENVAKPAVSFGGKYRMIDFSLSNCVNSGIDTVGVLVQYKPFLLNKYLGTGAAWDLDAAWGGVQILPPYFTQTGGEWYQGTADAIYHNIDYIDSYNPEYVLILSGDHLYQMDYSLMLEYHKLMNSDLTVAVKTVPMEEASRFGIMSVDDEMRITKFSEKPKNPDSNLASMGIYIFTWKVLREALLKDHVDPNSDKDFGKNIIPALLNDGMRLFAFSFNDYWKDVGTIDSLWEANMDLLTTPLPIDLHDKKWRVYARNVGAGPQYVAECAEIENSLISEGCEVFGKVHHSILSTGDIVEEGAEVVDSVIMPGSRICKGAKVYRAIIAENVVIGENAVVGAPDGEIAVVGNNTSVPQGDTVQPGEQRAAE